MIALTPAKDHALGRPDPKYRKYQISAVLLAWSAIIYAKPHGPYKKISQFFGRRLTVWQIIVITYMVEYIRRNFGRITSLYSPEPFANMYNRDYFRATWITTALDAGFWTAMRLRPMWLRHTASMLFTVYYLFAAEAAEDKVRRVRAVIGKEHMRVSWNKGTTPLLALFGRLQRPRHLRIRYQPRQVRIPRPRKSPYTEPVHAWLYFDGPLSEMKNQDKIILDVPGGGFVAMDPRCHDDKLIAWAAKTGFPVIALDYKKAPEYPYPYALNEAFDAYFMIQTTAGRCVGLPGTSRPKIVLSGDSAGGNLATGLVLMLLQARSETLEYLGRKYETIDLPLPEALILIYPNLDVNMTSWLNDEQSALIEEPARRKVNKNLVKRQTEDYHRLADTPLPSEDEDEETGLHMTPSKPPKKNGTTKSSKDGPSKTSSNAHSGNNTRLTASPQEDVAPMKTKKKEVISTRPRPLRTKLKTTSMISYVNDRILSPELLRGMIFLYIGEHNRPDFVTDFLLSPLRAPEHYLREFPKVYMLTGEMDPLCDDTAIFAGRLRSAHRHHFQTRKDLGIVPEREEFEDSKHFEVHFIPGVSHGFLQFASIYEPAWEYIQMCSRWMKQAFADAADREERSPEAEAGQDYFGQKHTANMHRQRRASQNSESSDNEDLALEMTALSQVHVPKSRHQASGGSRKRRRSRGGIRKAFDGRISPIATRNAPSLQRLTSPEHLIERRMDNVATGLMGDDSRPVTPL
ncbi:hypothetical protein LTR37_016721 [Vermiconidia calcicola]|uniref:Uncharacterized protein n=1 Tax=Vermiconidia calcicola TaxID=1690605 RepID=A0ACC3MNJ4_9PEZI|nr:hypothetical protein LTR37_016721 [Vermiconidia calcicola]